MNLRLFAIHLCFYFPLVLLLQYKTGIYQSELSHDPDEAAHVVTSLLIHDYATSGLHTSPLHFAENYYIHYPKVAFGIWPPMFHATAAVWMLIFTRTHTSLLILVAFICAVGAATLALFARRMLPPFVAFALGLFMILLPAFQNATSVVMVDGFLTVMELLTMLAMIAFFRAGTMKTAVWFGLVTSLALLTKANANAVPLAGLAMLLLTRRFSILKSAPLYVAGTMVVLLGGPWQVVTLRLFQGTVPLAPLTLARFWVMLSGYTVILADRLSLPIFLLALAGLAIELVPMVLGRRRDPQTFDIAGAASLLLGIIFFQSITTNALPVDRYILPVLPLLLLFAALGLRRIVSAVAIPGVSTLAKAVVVTVLLLGWFAKTTFAIPSRPQMGFQKIAASIVSSSVSNEVVLVCSDVWGEGALITTLALGDHPDNHIVLRGTKVLSENMWVRSPTYVPLFHSAEELEQYLESVPVDAVLIDASETLWEQDRALLQQTMTGNPALWALVSETPQGPDSRHLLLYRWAGPDHSSLRKNIQLRMRLMLGRDLLLK